LTILILNLSGTGVLVRFGMQIRAVGRDHLRCQRYATKGLHHLAAMKRAFSDLQLNRVSRHLGELNSRRDVNVLDLPPPYENLRHGLEKLSGRSFLEICS
jgi:hypothetical protein